VSRRVTDRIKNKENVGTTSGEWQGCW